MYTMDASLYANVQANITTVRFIDPTNLEVENFVRQKMRHQSIDANRITTEIALIYDMTVLFAKSFNDNETFARNFFPHKRYCSNKGSQWSYGAQILQNIDSVNRNI